MKTITIKFTKDFYNPLSKKVHLAGSFLEIEADSENFPIHSFWQSQFQFNDLGSHFEIISSEIAADKPKKSK